MVGHLFLLLAVCFSFAPLGAGNLVFHEYYQQKDKELTKMMGTPVYGESDVDPLWQVCCWM